MPIRPKRHGDSHPRPPDRDRSSSCERGYNYRWQQRSRRFLERHPLCVRCHAAGRLEPATVVDHITPHRGDQRLFWDERNWQALCEACHNRKTGAGL